MKKIFTLGLIVINILAYSQIAMNSGKQSNRWTFGGGLGVGFGSNSYFNLQVSPRVGYKITDQLEGGIIGNVSWQSSDYYKSTMFGVGPFVNYYFARSFFIGANLQQYFINSKEKFTGYKFDTDETALYLGGGYMQSLGNNAFVQFGIMYNVLWKERSSIFSSGFIPSVGFVVGL
ncbi:hypothetical protein ACFO4P_04600 [Epilithonimonas pallida]|uniref:Outer membrane protein beta-barrel domain-containing protein n=1 Tax=Epilithonimonas pallida TaxID=373671 RepID=A0ABY1R029_9FLAO|nr:hypothetical protein [Epilithonimonas pallida]SMP90320.1 hypothetical protein SAMN05421679_102271 [Epilithonimonas pallida]